MSWFSKKKSPENTGQIHPEVLALMEKYPDSFYRIY
jgi:hypothetical protein